MFSSIRGLSAQCRHYFVKDNGRWRCTMCGAVK
jgi:hypothetical protein